MENKQRVRECGLKKRSRSSLKIQSRTKFTDSERSLLICLPSQFPSTRFDLERFRMREQVEFLLKAFLKTMSGSAR